MGVGDFDGDGVSDFLIGAENPNPATGNNEAYLVYGGSNSTIDVNALSSSGVTLSVGTQEIIGGGGIGDFNGDGHDDLALAVYDGTDTANIYVIMGSDGLPNTLTLSDLESSNMVYKLSFNGIQSTDDFTISGIGDMDGDGFDDFAIGQPQYDTSAGVGNDGKINIVHGQAFGTNVQTGTNLSAAGDGDALVGTAGNNLLSDGGKNDVSMRGGSGNDVFLLQTNNFLNIDGGLGQDTLRFMGSGGTIDFSAVTQEQLSGVEAMQLGADSQTMLLTVDNIFNLLKTSDNGELKIELNSNGGVLSGNLVIDEQTGADPADTYASIATTLGGTHVGATGGYEQFDIGGYTLYIDQDVTVAVQ